MTTTLRRSSFVCLLLAAGILTSACNRSSPPSGERKVDQHWSFDPEKVVFDARFPRARLSECVRIGDNEFGGVVRPENLPVNNSAWFAFKVSAEEARDITLRLRFQGGSVRYRPKISTDGTHWVPLPAEAFEEGPTKDECTLKLEVGPEPLWVAAQELVSTAEMAAWARTLERLPFVAFTEFGKSVSGRSLFKLDIGSADAVRHVSIIGRQHPPETTGSLALMRFVEQIVGDTDLARTFRTEFQVQVIPLMNPDGVDAGHWRHNLGHVDLNRDWGPFAQPETQSAREQIGALAQRGRLFLHLDFHSTFNDVFYIQPEDAPSFPPAFTKRWLDGIQTRVPEYQVERSASSTPIPTTSAHWAHRTFDIAGITYELGDKTERSLLRRIAAEAADEMMTLLLEMKDAE